MVARKRRIAIRRYMAPLAFVGCVFLVGLSSAKMVSTGAIQKTGQMHIAGWSVGVTSTSSGGMVLDAGGNGQTYALTVTNNSEVASSYAIKVSNIPAGIKVGLDISSSSDLVTPTNGEVIFTSTGGDLGYTAPNNERNHTLTLAAEPSANATQNSVNLAIDVVFTQKDPGV